MFISFPYSSWDWFWNPKCLLQLINLLTVLIFVQPFYVLYFARWYCVANTKNLLNAYQYTVCLAMFICFPYSSLRLDPETQNVFYNLVKLPIYPSPKIMVTLTSHLGQKNNTGLGKMGGQFPNGKTEISWCISLPKFEKKIIKKIINN